MNKREKARLKRQRKAAKPGTSSYSKVNVGGGKAYERFKLAIRKNSGQARGMSNEVLDWTLTQQAGANSRGMQRLKAIVASYLLIMVAALPWLPVPEDGCTQERDCVCVCCEDPPT